MHLYFENIINIHRFFNRCVDEHFKLCFLCYQTSLILLIFSNDSKHEYIKLTLTLEPFLNL